VSEAPPRDVFDEVFALLDPARLLHDPRANGEGVTVCVIDSGVERSLLEEKFARQGQLLLPIEGAVFTPDRPEPLPYEGHQSTPHGTTVADILFTLAPRIRLYSADVFGPRGTCEVEVVIRALRWAIDVWKCKVVNLSLGVPEQRLQQVPRRQQLLRAIEDGYYKDVLIFAAAHNEHPFTRSYPAAFAPPLLSVDKNLFGDPLQFAYHLREQVEFQAHGRGYLGPFAHEPATSWAAPHLAGIAARILSLRPALKPFEMKTLLYWMFQSGQGVQESKSRRVEEEEDAKPQAANGPYPSTL
jgi:subtilisin